MPITYGMTLAKSWGAQRMRGTVLMKAYVPHTEKSEVFLSYQHADQGTALELAADLDRRGRCVFIDVYDDTLLPGNRDLDDALMTAITNADTMVIIISDETQGSWWVPWEICVSTPSRKPRALYRPVSSRSLPSYLQKLERLQDSTTVNRWVVDRSRRP